MPAEASREQALSKIGSQKTIDFHKLKELKKTEITAVGLI